MDFGAFVSSFNELGPALGVVVAIVVVVIAFLWAIIEMMKRFFAWMDQRDIRTMSAWDGLKKSLDANTESSNENKALLRENISITRSMHSTLERLAQK